MKNVYTLITVLALAFAITSCSNNKKAEPLNAQATFVTDSADFAAYQQWKINKLNKEEKTVEATPIVQKAAIPVKKKKMTKPIAATTPTQVYQSGSATVTPSTPVVTNDNQQVQEKKGWSKAAKGAAIGMGTGAVVGAVISKNNRVLGGVIGSAVGGAVGYGIGRSMDKKDGRY